MKSAWKKKVRKGWITIFKGTVCTFEKTKEMAEAAMPDTEDWEVKHVKITVAEL